MQDILKRTDPEVELGRMAIDDTRFASFTLGQRILHLEVEGYVVLPGMLDAARIERLACDLPRYRLMCPGAAEGTGVSVRYKSGPAAAPSGQDPKGNLGRSGFVSARLHVGGGQGL